MTMGNERHMSQGATSGMAQDQGLLTRVWVPLDFVLCTSRTVLRSRQRLNAYPWCVLDALGVVVGDSEPEDDSEPVQDHRNKDMMEMVGVVINFLSVVRACVIVISSRQSAG